MTRYLIIGAGAAGFSAAETLRKLDPAGQVLLLCEEPEAYYSRPGLAYYLTGEIPEPQLFPLPAAQFARLGIELIQAQVKRILPAQQQVVLQDGRLLHYDRCLIATGAQALPLQVPGAGLEGVVKLDNLSDARRILRLARKARSAVVVGGGITALEIVEGLRARRLQVHYFLRKDRYWGNVLDESESRLVEQRLAAEGVRLHYHTDLAEILGKNGRLSAVRTSTGQIIPCDLLAAAVGIQPRLELATECGLAVERGILVDEFMQTSHSQLYAAGDVAQVYDPSLGKSVLDSLWGPAREQGHSAAQSMAGQPLAYHKPVAFNVTRLAGLTTTIIGAVGQGRDADLVGIARGDSEVWRQVPDALAAQEEFEVNRLRLLIGPARLLGALLMGDQQLSRPLQQLILQKVDISPIRARLLAPGAPVAELIASFWLDWSRRNAPQPQS